MYAAIRVGEDKSLARVTGTHSELVTISKLAEVAAVVSMSETANGLHPAYIGGRVTLYDPVANEFVGPHDRHHEHAGWIS